MIHKTYKHIYLEHKLHLDKQLGDLIPATLWLTLWAKLWTYRSNHQLYIHLRDHAGEYADGAK